MSLRIIEGIDHDAGTNPQVNKWDTGFWTNYGAGRIAGRCGTPAGSLTKAFDNQATWVFGAAIKADGNGAVNVDFRDGASVQCRLSWDGTNGVLNFYRGASAVLLGTTGAPAMAQGLWYYVEAKVTIHDTTGAFDVHISGVSRVSGTNVNTRGGTANNYANTIAFSSSGGNTPLDDIYLCDGAGALNNDFLGDSRVETQMPSGAGASTQFTPSAGSNYQCVDEVPAPNGDTDYVSSSNVGDQDFYAIPALPTTVGTVRGVQVSAYARKDDAGARSLSVEIRASDGTVVQYSAQPLLTSYAFYLGAPRETDPATGAAWTIAGVNAAQPGIRVAG